MISLKLSNMDTQIKDIPVSEQNNETNTVEKDPVGDMLESLKKNQKLIFALVGSALVAFGAFTAMESYKKNQEMKAQAGLFKIEKQIENFERKMAKDKKTSSDYKFEDSYAGFATSLESFISSNKDKKAAMRASLLLARIYGEYSKPEKALNALNLLQPKVEASMLSVLFHTQKLTQLIDTKNFDEAVSLADKILSIKELDFTHAVAKLKKAIAVEAKGAKEEARTLYKQVSEDYPEHPAGQTAKQYLRIAN